MAAWCPKRKVKIDNGGLDCTRMPVVGAPAKVLRTLTDDDVRRKRGSTEVRRHRPVNV